MTNKFTLPKGAEWYNKSKGIYIERLTDRTPEWHEKRTQGIGGSECGNVLGLNDNPGGSVIELFYQKIGMKPSVLKDNNYMLMGRILEDTVANLWQYYSGDMNSVIENMNSGNVVRKCRNVNGVLTQNSAEVMLRKRFNNVGLVGREYSAHSFRYTQAMDVLEQTGDESLASRQLRHLSPKTIQYYVQEIRAKQNAKSMLDLEY